MVQDAIEVILRQKLGLDANSVGSRLIERAVKQRQTAYRLTDRAAYLALLRSSPQELNQLIEAVVVPETWFFRDKEPFEFLRQSVKTQSLQHQKRQPAGIFRVLSLPCSTGEEPYSIAITLLETGLTSDQFRVDAVDVSQQALLKAKQGVYRKKSFRGGAIQNREQYFQPQGDGYVVRSTVQQSVHFQQGNVLEPHFLMGKQYHAIFCRNLLIYLSEAARHQVIDSLDRALLPLGLLFLGAAETSQIANRPYQAIDHPFAFAYQKLADQKLADNVAVSAPDLSATRLPSIHSPSPNPSPSHSPGADLTIFSEHERAAKANPSGDRPLHLPRLPHDPIQPVVPAPAKLENLDTDSPARIPDSPNRLDIAKQLADRGELMKAAQICETYLRVHPTEAIAYLLLGEIYQGLNQTHPAERCFQKAVYLDPNSYEALIYLALLKEQQGNHAEAARLKRRAQRLSELSDQGYG